MTDTLKEYEVNFISKKGSMSSATTSDILKNEANVLTDFCSPWDEAEISKIEFRALWDFANFYFQFTVYDKDVHLQKENDSFESIGNSDRVELFFRSDENLSPYYCFEIDAAARIMDFEAYPNKNFDFGKNWPSNDIKVQSTGNECHFVVEGTISLDSLKKNNLIKDGKIEVGVFRAKYNKTENGEFKPTWITWVNPQTETPNFHVSSSFGTFILKD